MQLFDLCRIIIAIKIIVITSFYYEVEGTGEKLEIATTR